MHFLRITEVVHIKLHLLNHSSTINPCLVFLAATSNTACIAAKRDECLSLHIFLISWRPYVLQPRKIFCNVVLSNSATMMKHGNTLEYARLFAQHHVLAMRISFNVPLYSIWKAKLSGLIKYCNELIQGLLLKKTFIAKKFYMDIVLKYIDINIIHMKIFYFRAIENIFLYCYG